MNSIIVFGATGQLGHCIKSVTETSNTHLIFQFLEKREVNILDSEMLESVFKKYKPSYCINCAAYTAVDKAEDEKAAAMQINKTGVEKIGTLCAKYNSILIHISTDFVFAGNKAEPLNEQDETFPINVYGETKLAGENAVRAVLTKYFIIRTSWLYSEHGNNFVKTMLKLGTEKPELKVIADQVGTPTYAIDLANCILAIINQGSSAYGTYHFSNEGVTSWYDFAKSIFDIAGINVKVTPVKTQEYITKAIRPPYSLMDKSKFKTEFGQKIPYWIDSLRICISKLQNND